jgi:hypothetical protein
MGEQIDMIFTQGSNSFNTLAPVSDHGQKRFFCTKLPYLNMVGYEYSIIWGIWWHNWLRHLVTNRKFVGSIMSLEFFIGIILPAAI